MPLSPGALSSLLNQSSVSRFDPLAQPSGQIPTSFLAISSIVDPAHFLEAGIVSFPGQVIKRIAQKVDITALPSCLWVVYQVALSHASPF